MTPLVPARLRMWQEPHLATNSSLPLIDVVAAVGQAAAAARAERRTPIAQAPSANPRTVLLTIGAES